VLLERDSTLEFNEDTFADSITYIPRKMRFRVTRIIPGVTPYHFVYELDKVVLWISHDGIFHIVVTTQPHAVRLTGKSNAPGGIARCVRYW
jgi:hypothetical protein